MRKRFNQYCLTKQIANKSSGSVYLAHHVSNGPQKVILEMLDAASFTFNQQDENIFQKIKMIKQLRHASIVPIMDLGIEGGQPYVVREYHTCESLCHLLDRLSPQRLNLQEALTIIQQVGQVISYAHQYHFLHGSIKPETIFLQNNGEVLLSDFGLANFIDVTKPSQKFDLRTISYMAPEQFVGSLTEKGDQYSLACLAYELVTGCVPFSAQSTFSVIAPISGEHVSGKVIKRGGSGDGDQVVLGQAGSFCENNQCPDYGKAGKNNVHKYGRTRKGGQRWRCKTCQTTWSASSMWTKYHLEFLIPLSDLVPDLPRPIQEAVLKAMAKDPSDRYSTVSLFLKALEGASSSTPSVSSRHPLMGSSLSTFVPTVAEPLEDLESDIPLPTQLNEAPLTTRLSERSEHIYNGYESSKVLMTAAGDTYVEASPQSRLSHLGKSPTPTLWLAFALSGIILLLGSVLLYILVPLRSPASNNPVKASPTVSIATPTATVQPTPQTRTTLQVMPTPTPIPSPVVRQIITIDDSIKGTGLNQFNYVGNGWGCANGCNGDSSNPYNGSWSWDNTTGDYVTVSFTGVQIKFYGVIGSHGGIGAISLDGGSKTMIDFYSTAYLADQLMWTSPMLPAGTHTFKLRVTGTKNPSSDSCSVGVDRVDILS